MGTPSAISRARFNSDDCQSRDDAYAPFHLDAGRIQRRANAASAGTAKGRSRR
jgi:hypothetical protein